MEKGFMFIFRKVVITCGWIKCWFYSIRKGPGLIIYICSLERLKTLRRN